jgi:UDP-N-acetyl-D-glucosamine dehydrogenase
VLLVGVAYKADVNDTRESPALRIMHLLRAEGAHVEYHDPHVERLPKQGMTSVPLNAETLGDRDVVVVVTPHRAVDWEMVARESRLVVDLRNVVPSADGKVWRL